MLFKSLAIIPARSGSIRLKDKNIRILNGHPLIAYTIMSALESEVFDKVIVSTDSEIYARLSKFYGATVDFLRPTNLSDSNSPSIDLIRHAIEFYESKGIFYENVCLLQPTSPLRTSTHIQKVDKLFSSHSFDSLVSVTRGVGKYLNIRAMIENNYLVFSEFTDSIKMENESYYPNGAIFYFKTNYIKEKDVYYTKNTCLFEMESNESIDIDDLNDFNRVEKSIGKKNQ